MAKKKAKRNRVQQVNLRPMTMARLAEVRDWLDSMNCYLGKSIELSKRMDSSKVDQGSDSFWALVKYAENVQECILQLDNLNPTILPTLDEIPLEVPSNVGFTWKGMKGMRHMLAHDFRKIDPEVLWQTVTNDFPVLRSLISRVVVSETSVREGTFEARFNVGVFRSMPAFEQQEKFRPGNSVIALYFDGSHQAKCVRFARVDDRTIRIVPSDDLRFSGVNISLVDQDGSVEQLVSWPSVATTADS